jgi:hypothetical protein
MFAASSTILLLLAFIIATARRAGIQVQRFDRMWRIERIGPIAPGAEHSPRAGTKQLLLLR